MTDHGGLLKQPHTWLRRVTVAGDSPPDTPFLKEVLRGLFATFGELGHQVRDVPDATTDVVLTTAPLGEPISWRHAPLFTARRRYGLSRSPAVYTLIHATPTAFEELLDHFQAALVKSPPDPGDYRFPGLVEGAWRVLDEQARRGGAILALERLLQAQAKSLRILLVVGEERPLRAFHFDLVGAHPVTDGSDLAAFYRDIVLRMVTTVSTDTVTKHVERGEPIPSEVWQRLGTPPGLVHASEQLGLRGFFTEPVVIGDLVRVPVVSDAVASQYSEGCFATWEPALPGLVATVTGSARPIHKGRITTADLAVVVGVRDDLAGAVVRPVERMEANQPSSEALEMMLVDQRLPTVELDSSRGVSEAVPVVRSKLHGHRGVGSFDPAKVEYVPLDIAYHDYPVSCASGAQALGVQKAFARSETLRNPQDSRQVVFTVLPGHGILIAEKWVEGTEPLQVIWEHIDDGSLAIVPPVPQGRLRYLEDRGVFGLET